MSLADTAGAGLWNAFAGGQQQAQQQGTTNLANMGALQAILAKAKEAQMAQQFRDEFAAAPTDEAKVAVAAKYGGPKEFLGHADRLTTAANTRELAMMRLTQQAQQAARTATTAEQKAALDSWYKRSAMSIAQGRATYELPPDLAPVVTPAPGAPGGPVATPVAAPAGALPVGVPMAPAGRAGLPPPPPTPQLPEGQALQTTAPDLSAAMQQFAEGGGVPRTVTLPPEQAPDAGNLDARDLAARAAASALGTAPVAPVVAPAAATAPVMPQFSGSRKEIAAQENKWKQAQAKGGEAGGKASQTVVDAIEQGRMPLPTGFALRSPYWQDVIERVNKQNPNFEGGKYTARTAAMRTFAAGPEGRNVTALNTVIGHLGTLDEAATALANNDFRAFNAVANRLATETGDPRVQNFDTAKQAVAEETMRVFRQVGASESESKAWGERINSSGSPQQLRGVIGTLGKLLDSRVEAIGQQYERTVNQKGNPARVDPANREKLDKLINQGGAPNWDAAKEQRYQELKAKQGGS